MRNAGWSSASRALRAPGGAPDLRAMGALVLADFARRLDQVFAVQLGDARANAEDALAQDRGHLVGGAVPTSQHLKHQGAQSRSTRRDRDRRPERGGVLLEAGMIGVENRSGSSCFI